MKKLIAYFFFIAFVGMACSSPSNVSAQNTDEHVDLTDTTYFNLAKKYIFENGRKEYVNISSEISQERIIEYRILKMDNWEMTVDHSQRIYFTQNGNKYGNILNENGTVQPEINYGAPDTHPKITKEKEVQVLKIYEQLVTLALKKR